jgi:alginate O-acetyltransferase complex protein AlgI
MALGAAHMLGYKLAKNFNMPYLATNVSEFWHRWHISLSTWLRDYLFIPLGGSRNSDCPRCNRWMTNRNLLITMTLGGLWHGASWTFVVWGLLHGLLLIIHRSFREFCAPRPHLNKLLQSPPGTLFRMALTFLSVCIGWIIFRTPTFSDALAMLRRMFGPRLIGAPAPLDPHSLWVIVSVMALCHLLAYRHFWNKMSARLPAPMFGFGYAMVLTLILVLAPSSGKSFIYFQF